MNLKLRDEILFNYLNNGEILTEKSLYEAVKDMHDDYYIMKQKYRTILENCTEKDMKCEELEDRITDLKHEIRNLGGDINE